MPSAKDPIGEKGPDTHMERGLTTLYVCTSCRPKGHPKEPYFDRPGYKLYQELSLKIEKCSFKDLVDLRPIRCLSLCPRPCGIAFSSQGGWSYLFGDQKHGETTSDILGCLELYLIETDGHLSRERRPKSLQAGILGRVPPTMTLV